MITKSEFIRRFKMARRAYEQECALCDILKTRDGIDNSILDDYVEIMIQDVNKDEDARVFWELVMYGSFTYWEPGQPTTEENRKVLTTPEELYDYLAGEHEENWDEDLGKLFIHSEGY